jgi:uncharacterized protein (TIGR02266 family)
MPTDRRAPGRDRRAKSAAAKEKEAPAKVALRKRERRMGDRRESPRLPIKVWVKNTGGTFEEVEGDISVGGMHFLNKLPIKGKRIDLRFKLPGREAEVRVSGEVVQVSAKGDKHGAHVKFTDLDIDTELAIARFIDERTGG